MRRHDAPRAVWFDLDGTLVDTAGDLLAALDAVRASLGLAPNTDPNLHLWVSEGSLGLMRRSLPPATQSDLPRLQRDFLDYYRAHICVHSRLYPGAEELLSTLQARGVAWGIVTNKPYGLARALVDALGLSPGVLIGGDSLPQCKPAPEPIWAACQELAVAPAQSWMLGDDRRDIQAAQAAGCALSFACSYGYVPDLREIASWGADYQLSALELSGYLD